MRLLGSQTRIARFVGFLAPRFYKADKEKIEDDVARLIDALTGGRFREAGRDVDYERARLAQVVAAEVTFSVRNAFMNRASIKVRISHCSSTGGRWWRSLMEFLFG